MQKSKSTGSEKVAYLKITCSTVACVTNELNKLCLWGEVWAILVTQEKTPTLSLYATKQGKVIVKLIPR